jgi:sporulation protein YlmC with PRC-barrel domain
MVASRENPDFLSADSLKDDKVVNTAGEDLGKFEDLMIDLIDGRVAYAALSFGGVMGLGNKLFAIPWKSLKLKVHEHAFILDIPKETLKNSEGFDKGKWPVTTREWLSNMHSYYGYQPYWETGETGKTAISESERMSSMKSTPDRDRPEFLPASDIQGKKVINRDGDHIGKVEDIMVDLQNGRIACVVITHGGILGLGSKQLAIPWQALSLRARENAFVLDISKETVDKAEGLDKDRWPVTYGELSSIYDYYGYQPYWLAGAAVAGVVGERETRRVSSAEKEVTEKTKTVEVGVVVEEKELETTGITEERVVVEERVSRTETEEEIRARQERERLEKLRGTQEEKISQLEKQRMERERQAQAERERLDQLERERIEVERQAEAERQRLAQLEMEMQEARRKEETERVARLEKELTEVQTQEELRRERLTQLQRECTEARKQAELERESLVQLERERTEVERQAAAERERLAQLERERMAVPTAVETAAREIPDFLSTSTIKTDRVVNTAGEDLGRIEELMIDLDSGRVAYAVLSFGGFLGMADKLFAIPWNALTLRAHEHAFTLDIPKDVLERAEGFDKNEWPLTRSELSRTYTYYGYQPYWQREVTERTGLRGEMESERPSMGRERPLETAEERMARQDKERIETQEREETDKERLERLEKEKMIAERREQKYK